MCHCCLEWPVGCHLQICWVHKKERSTGTGGLAAAPHLPTVSGCGRHPITHPYRFAKPAPVSLDMWHEGQSAKWNPQVTPSLWICCALSLLLSAHDHSEFPNVYNFAVAFSTTKKKNNFPCIISQQITVRTLPRLVLGDCTVCLSALYTHVIKDNGNCK